MYRVSPHVRNFGRTLAAGVALATLWVNLDPASYYDAIEWRIADVTLPAWMAVAPAALTPMSVVSEGLMAILLFFVGKELWEALVLDRGALSGRRVILPLGLTLGGVAGAILVWLLATALFQTAEEAAPGAGWPVPVGSDVVLCYIVGRALFGPRHPALHLLLLLAIAFDILGLALTVFADPAARPSPVWLLLPVLAAVGVWRLHGRLPAGGATERQRRRAQHLWPYLVAGVLSWIGVLFAGLPGALGLLPVIPAIAHADRSFGLFAEAEALLHDPLNRLAHLAVRPLAVILFLFGLTRGGIDLAAFAPTTAIVLLAFWIGKPLGLVAGGLVAQRLSGTRLPADIDARAIGLVALILGMGFTVPVLAVDATLPGGAVQEAARLGLALTLLAGPLALGLARVTGQRT